MSRDRATGSRASSSSASCEAAKTVESERAVAPERVSSSEFSCASPMPSSLSQPRLSLSHPVVEFLASIQMQGYAAHIIEDLGLRTMPALLSSVSCEADVVRLLGPYASLQQQSELWRGLQRWEKEEARRLRAEAEERRRQQQADAREQRRQVKKQRKSARQRTETTRDSGAKSTGDGERESDERRGGTDGQLPMTFFTQLRQERCFSFPDIYARTSDEFTVSSTSLQAFTASRGAPNKESGYSDCQVDPSSSITTTTVAARRPKLGRHQLPPHAPCGFSCDSFTSCASLTRSATQLMRDLSYQCTNAAHTCRCRRGSRGGERNRGSCDFSTTGGELLSGQTGSLSNVAATQAVPYDVDAEDGVEVEETLRGSYGDGQHAQKHDCGSDRGEHTTSSSVSNNEEREDDVASAAQSPSRQSSESHLSSLLGSLRERRDDNDRASCHCDTAGEDEDVPRASGSVEEHMTTQAAAETLGASSCFAQLHHPHMSVHSPSSAVSGVGLSVHNGFVTTRHVSLSALSTHAELDQVPPSPPSPPPLLISRRQLHQSSRKEPCTKAPDVTEALVSSSSSSLPDVDNNDDEAVMRGGAVEVVAIDSCACCADTGNLSSDSARLARLAEARERLERALCEALRRYNADVASAFSPARPDTADVVSQEGQRDGDLCRLRAPVCAVLHPLPAKAAELVRWAAATTDTGSNSAAAPAAPLPPPPPSLFTCAEDEARWESSRASCSGGSARAQTQPPLSAYPNEERPAIILPIRASQCNSCSPSFPSVHPLPSSGKATAAADVVRASSCSTDMSASATARPTTAPGVTFASRNLQEEGSDEGLTNLLEAGPRDAESPHGAIPTAQRQEWASRCSTSAAQLTACTQDARLHLASCDALGPRHTLQGAHVGSLGDFAVSRSVSQTVEQAPHDEAGGTEEEEEAERRGVGGSNDAADPCRDPVWVDEEEEEDGEGLCEPRETSVFHDNHNADVRAEDEVQRQSSQDWWDSYGLDALAYTQNCMDDTLSVAQDDDNVKASQRRASPAVRPAANAARSRTVSPLPTEVVEVTSNDEEEEQRKGDVLAETAPDCSQSPAVVARAASQPRRFPGATATTPRSRDSAFFQTSLRTLSKSNLHASSSLYEADCTDPRLQPSAWRRMTREELRGLCEELGVAVRPTTHITVQNSTLLSPSSLSPSPARRPSRSRPGQCEVRSSSPDWISLYGIASLTADAASESAARASPLRTCRELFQPDTSSGCAASPTGANATQNEQSSVVRQGGTCDVDDSAKNALEKAKEEEEGRRRLAPPPRCDGRMARLEREALLEALQQLAVRVRFRRRVAPFFLHRVERFSGLPYRRVRAADLLDEASVLTRDDLQQARQRYKAEEQAEVERCVLAALAADAVEATEHHAQQQIFATTATSPLDQGGESSFSRLGDSSPGSSLDHASTTVPALSCYDQMLLREPVNVEAVAATVQRSFPHVAHARVQQLLTLNEVIAEAVVVTAPRSSASPPPSADTVVAPGKDLAKPPTAAAAAAEGVSPSQEAPTLSQEALRRANTRRFFAQRGHMMRRGAWGRGGHRGRGGRG